MGISSFLFLAEIVLGCILLLKLRLGLNLGLLRNNRTIFSVGIFLDQQSEHSEGAKGVGRRKLLLGLRAMAFTIRLEPICALDASPIGSPLYKCWLLLIELNSQAIVCVKATGEIA